MLPDKYVSKVANELDAPLKGRVFYVTGPGILNGRTASVRHFGQAEVTIYSGKTARALLEEWREDLLHRTAGRVVCALSKRLSTTRAARRAVAVWPVGSTASGQALPRSESGRALRSTHLEKATEPSHSRECSTRSSGHGSSGRCISTCISVSELHLSWGGNDCSSPNDLQLT